jgi:hypothetical protein
MTAVAPAVPGTVAHELRLDAEAFRKHTVYTMDGDPVRLGVNAERMEAGAAAIEALQAHTVALAEALDMLISGSSANGTDSFGQPVSTVLNDNLAYGAKALAAYQDSGL